MSYTKHCPTCSVNASGLKINMAGLIGCLREPLRTIVFSAPSRIIRAMPKGTCTSCLRVTTNSFVVLLCILDRLDLGGGEGELDITSYISDNYEY